MAKFPSPIVRPTLYLSAIEAGTWKPSSNTSERIVSTFLLVEKALQMWHIIHIASLWFKTTGNHSESSCSFYWTEKSCCQYCKIQQVSPGKVWKIKPLRIRQNVTFFFLQTIIMPQLMTLFLLNYNKQMLWRSVQENANLK